MKPHLGVTLAAAAGLLTTTAWAQAPSSTPRPRPPAAGSGPRPPGAITPPTRSSVVSPGEGLPSDDPQALTEAQRTKRLERVIRRAEERRANREQRRRDRRRALKRRLGRVLDNGPLPAAAKVELQQHARRVAKLRRIRVVAAEAKDIDTVMRVDRVLARETLRHERWWTRRLSQLAPDAQEPGP